MKFLLIAIAAVLIIVVFKACISTDQLAKDVSRPSLDKKPTTEKSNDKMIVIKNVKHSQLKMALNAFCNIYNKDDFAALPRLYQLQDDTFAIIFPFDTDIDTFCFAVNFLKYPINIKWQADVHGWTTIKESDGFMIDNLTNKLSMIYLDKEDKEYDNVFLTSKDGTGYKIPFTNVKPKILPMPIENFKYPTIKLEDLNNLAFEDID